MLIQSQMSKMRAHSTSSIATFRVMLILYIVSVLFHIYIHHRLCLRRPALLRLPSDECHQRIEHHQPPKPIPPLPPPIPHWTTMMNLMSIYLLIMTRRRRTVPVSRKRTAQASQILEQEVVLSWRKQTLERCSLQLFTEQWGMSSGMSSKSD